MENTELILSPSLLSGQLSLMKNNIIKEAKPLHALVKVHYSALNFAEMHMLRGLYPDAPKGSFVPGYEFSGEVIAINAEPSNNLQVGDLVMGGLKFGAHSSYVQAPLSQLRKISELKLDAKESAAAPVSLMTAHILVHRVLRWQKGDNVLVDCASGALGQVLAKMGQQIGVNLYGLTARKNKLSKLSELGYIGSLVNDRAGLKVKFDSIINSRGGDSFKADYKNLVHGGHLVCIGASSMVSKKGIDLGGVLKTALNMPKYKMVNLINDNKAVSGVNVLRYFDDQQLLESIFQKIEPEHFLPKIDQVFSYKNARQGFDYLCSGESQGKVLLSWLD
jgi:alcohol dehydrogenase